MLETDQKIKRLFTVSLAGACAAIALMWPEWRTTLKAQGYYITVEPMIVLTEVSPNATVEADSIAKIYGTNGVNNITVESGADVELVNFQGSNTVSIESDPEGFTVYRSGATVTFHGSPGTFL